MAKQLTDDDEIKKKKEEDLARRKAAIRAGLPKPKRFDPLSFSQSGRSQVADVTRNYGALDTFVNEVLASGTQVVPAVLSRVAGVMGDVARSEHAAWLGRGNKGTLHEFLSLPGVRNDLRQQPVDFSLEASVFVKDIGRLGSKYPELESARTIGDAEQFVTRALLPGLLAAPAQQSENQGQDLSSSFSAMFTGFFESAFEYDRKFNISASQFYMNQGYFYSKNERRSEIIQRALVDKLASANMNQEPEGVAETGMNYDAGSGQMAYIDTNTVSDVGKAIGDLGGFESLPVDPGTSPQFGHHLAAYEQRSGKFMRRVLNSGYKIRHSDIFTGGNEYDDGEMRVSPATMAGLEPGMVIRGLRGAIDASRGGDASATELIATLNDMLENKQSVELLVAKRSWVKGPRGLRATYEPGVVTLPGMGYLGSAPRGPRSMPWYERIAQAMGKNVYDSGLFTSYRMDGKIITESGVANLSTVRTRGQNVPVEIDADTVREFGALYELNNEANIKGDKNFELMRGAINRIETEYLGTEGVPGLLGEPKSTIEMFNDLADSYTRVMNPRPLTQREMRRLRVDALQPGWHDKSANITGFTGERGFTVRPGPEGPPVYPSGPMSDTLAYYYRKNPIGLIPRSGPREPLGEDGDPTPAMRRWARAWLTPNKSRMQQPTYVMSYAKKQKGPIAPFTYVGHHPSGPVSEPKGKPSGRQTMDVGPATVEGRAELAYEELARLTHLRQTRQKFLGTNPETGLPIFGNDLGSPRTADQGWRFLASETPDRHTFLEVQRTKSRGQPFLSPDESKRRPALPLATVDYYNRGGSHIALGGSTAPTPADLALDALFEQRKRVNSIELVDERYQPTDPEPKMWYEGQSPEADRTRLKRYTGKWNPVPPAWRTEANELEGAELQPGAHFPRQSQWDRITDATAVGVEEMNQLPDEMPMDSFVAVRALYDRIMGGEKIAANLRDGRYYAGDPTVSNEALNTVAQVIAPQVDQLSKLYTFSRDPKAIEVDSERVKNAQIDAAYAAVHENIPQSSIEARYATMAGMLGPKNVQIQDVMTDKENEVNTNVWKELDADFVEGSVKNRSRKVREILGRLEKTHPKTAARIKYVGHAANPEKDEDFTNTVLATSLGYDVPLRFDPENPEEFGRMFEEIAKLDPAIANKIREVVGMPNAAQVEAAVDRLPQKFKEPASPARSEPQKPRPTPARSGPVNVNKRTGAVRQRDQVDFGNSVDPMFAIDKSNAVGQYDQMDQPFTPVRMANGGGSGAGNSRTSGHTRRHLSDGSGDAPFDPNEGGNWGGGEPPEEPPDPPVAPPPNDDDEDPPPPSPIRPNRPGAFRDRTRFLSYSKMRYSQMMQESANMGAWRRHVRQLSGNTASITGANYDEFIDQTWDQMVQMPGENVDAFINQAFPWANEDTRRTISSLARGHQAQFHPHRSGIAMTARDRTLLGQEAAYSILPHRVGSYSDSFFGKGFYHEADENGPERYGVASLASGRITGTQADVDLAMNWAQEAAVRAPLGALPDDPQDIEATIDSRLRSVIKQRAKELTKAIGNQPGKTHADAEAEAEAVESIANHLVKAAKDHIVRRMGGLPGSSASFHASNARTEEEIQSLFSSHPELARKAAQANLSPKQLASLDDGTELVLSTESEDGPKMFRFGGGGGGNWDGGSRRRSPFDGSSLWSGPVGRALYGAYLMKRLWSMSAGPGIAEADQYIGGIGMDYDRWVAMGESGGVAGLGSLSSITADRRGRAAAEVYGGANVAGYVLSGYGGGAINRLGQYAGLAGGIAGTAFMGGQILDQMGMLGDNIDPKQIARFGLVAGGATLYGGAVMELANQAFYGGRPAFTYGNALTNASALFATSRVAAGFVLSGGQDGTLLHRFFAPTQGMVGQFYERMTPEEQAAVTRTVNTYYGPQLEKQKRVTGLNELMAANSSEDAKSTFAAAMRMDQLFGEDFDSNMAVAFGQQAGRLGVTTVELQSGAEQYATLLGYRKDTEGFDAAFNNFAYLPSRGQQDQKTAYAQKVAQLGSQLQARMGADTSHTLGTEIVRRFNLTPTQVGVVSQYQQVMQQFGHEPNELQMSSLALFAGQNNAYVGGVIAGAASSVGMIGGDEFQAMNILSGVGMSNQQAFMFDAMLGGDLQALSYNAWQTGSYGMRWFDQSGNSIFETDGASALRTLNYWRNASSSVPGATAMQDALKRAGYNGTASSLFGFKGKLDATQQKIVNAFNEGGLRAVQWTARADAAEAQRNQAGMQAAGIALTEQYYWGSGSWDAPAAGSAWYLEDQMRALQHKSQMADFASQGARMEMAQSFAQSREANQLSRMNTSNAYNIWQMDFSYAQSLQQRAWTRQDWSLQDTSRELNYGWSMEDIDEAIRYSSGRDRRKLLRQRDRATISHNLEEEQVERSRSRQEETWAREDERFEKQKDYTLELQRLDKESYDQNVKERKDYYKLDRETYNRKITEYEAQRAIEEEMHALQRKYQAEQLELQKAIAGAAAQAAEDQRVYAEALAKGGENIGDVVGAMEQLNKYDNAFRTLNALEGFARSLNLTDKDTVDALKRLMDTIKSMTAQSVNNANNKLIQDIP